MHLVTCGDSPETSISRSWDDSRLLRGVSGKKPNKKPAVALVGPVDMSLTNDSTSGCSIECLHWDLGVNSGGRTSVRASSRIPNTELGAGVHFWSVTLDEERGVKTISYIVKTAREKLYAELIFRNSAIMKPLGAEKGSSAQEDLTLGKSVRV